MTGLRAKEAQCFSSVIASPAFYGFSSSNRYEQDVSDDVVQVHPATEIVLVPRLLLSSFEPGNGSVSSEYSVYSRFFRIVCQSIIPRLSCAASVSFLNLFRCHSIFRVFWNKIWLIKKSTSRTSQIDDRTKCFIGNRIIDERLSAIFTRRFIYNFFFN